MELIPLGDVEQRYTSMTSIDYGAVDRIGDAGDLAAGRGYFWRGTTDEFCSPARRQRHAPTLRGLLAAIDAVL
jgi:hypothetical protein